ncbi:MAG: PIN domain-containing protein [Isosphaeraceae bacterium]|jgi:predicted nucleic acid-binding protein
MTSIFVDTGAWFARFVPSDRDHSAAREWFEQNTYPLITTDYVIDEVLTVLKVRGEYQRALEVGPSLFNGDVCDLEWVTQADVRDAWKIFSTYRDKGWSFTDCVSRVVMERLLITTAVAFDEHFHQFGTVNVVP